MMVGSHSCQLSNQLFEAITDPVTINNKNVNVLDMFIITKYI